MAYDSTPQLINTFDYILGVLKPKIASDQHCTWKVMKHRIQFHYTYLSLTTPNTIMQIQGVSL